MPETRTRRPNAVHAFGSDEERRGMDFDVGPMDFGNRVPRLVPRGAPVAPIRERPIGLKDTDAPRPWTLRRVFGLLFLPRR